MQQTLTCTVPVIQQYVRCPKTLRVEAHILDVVIVGWIPLELVVVPGELQPDVQFDKLVFLVYVDQALQRYGEVHPHWYTRVNCWSDEWLVIVQ